ncbi:hypothetical protein ACLK19_26620 [Escherichia coli]
MQAGFLTPISRSQCAGYPSPSQKAPRLATALENGLTLVLKNIEFRLLDSDAPPARFWKRTIPGWRYFPARTFTGRRQRRIKLRRSDCHQCELLFAKSLPVPAAATCKNVPGVRDVCFQLLQQIYGEQRFPGTPATYAARHLYG